MAMLAQQRPSVLELSVDRQSNSESWAAYYNYPKYGAAFLFLSPGSPDFIGNAYCLVPYMRFSFLRQNRPVNLSLRKGWKNLLSDVSVSIDKETGILHIADKNKYSLIAGSNNRTTIYITYAGPLYDIRVTSDANLQSKDTIRNDFSFLGEHGGGNVFLLAENNNVSIGVNAVIDLRIEGKTNTLSVTNWGNAPLFFENLVSGHVSIVHRGLSDIFVNAQNTLDVEFFSSGNVFYTGQPIVTEIQHYKGKVYPLNPIQP